jgi:hypothetical protein
MKHLAIIILIACAALPALAEPMPSQIFEGYQRPPKPPPPKGYVTEDGKRYGTCRNRAHHGRHPHCKELVPLPKPKPAPAPAKAPEPPPNAKVVKP